MSQGTLYTNQRIRGVLPKAIIKAYNLDVKVAEPDAAFEKAFPLKKIPALAGPKGLKLTEVIAVSLYRMFQLLCSCDEKPFFLTVIPVLINHVEDLLHSDHKFARSL